MSHTPNPHSPPAASPKKHNSLRGAQLVVLLLLAVLIVLGVSGILRRSHDNNVLAERTDQDAPPTVNVAAPEMGSLTAEFVLPGNVTAYTDSPIYARTDGYLLHWYYDIGARVKKGDLLATIASPEVDQELTQAKAELATAIANAGYAKQQAQRYTDLLAQNAVTTQDTENFVTQAASTITQVKSAQANVDRLEQLTGFEKVYAPFDGVVTARTVDTGQLINQGAGTELFHMQALGTLRVYTNVPEVDSQTVKRGMKVALTFPEHPGKTFGGTLVRTADAIDPVSRTLLVEVDMDNRDGTLMPGSLAQVHFKAAPMARTFIVPASAVIFRTEDLQVGTVVKNNKGKTVAHLIPIIVGQNDGATMQVESGLNSGDQVIQDPPDSLIEGERVTVVQSQPASGAGSASGGK